MIKKFNIEESSPREIIKKIGLIACSKKKKGNNNPQQLLYAQDIYTGDAFKKSKNYCLDPANGFDDWHILSDKYGLLDRYEFISYYNVKLKNHKKDWANEVLEKLKTFYDLGNDIFYIFGGKTYYENLISFTNSVVFEYQGAHIKLYDFKTKAKTLRNKDILDIIVPDLQGYYRWWAEEKELDIILKTLTKNPQAIKSQIEKNKGLYCLCDGFAIKESLRQKLDSEVNDPHTVQRVRTGLISEFRQNIASIVAHNQYFKQTTNDFIDKLYIEFVPMKNQIQSDNAEEKLRNLDKNLINNKFFRPLNTDNNNHTLADEIIKALENLKKESKLEI